MKITNHASDIHHSPMELPSPPARKYTPRDQSVGLRYDAETTTQENARYYAHASRGSATTDLSLPTRSTIRARARHEHKNNSWCYGMVHTFCDWIVGRGPRLQLTNIDDAEDSQEMEYRWSEWAKSIGLADMLRVLRISQCVSGEAFVLLGKDELRSPIQLRPQLIEADQVSAHWSHTDELNHDGVVVDERGRILEYQVLDRHPGDGGWIVSSATFKRFGPDVMLHVFRQVRPGQVRGVSELAPALWLFAVLRRYTMAALSAAEFHACISGVVHTTGPAFDDPTTVPKADTSFDALDTIQIDRGQVPVLPEGYDLHAFESKQPTDQHDAFVDSVLCQISRVFPMPFLLVKGNAGGYNFASGRLDTQTFKRVVRGEQQRLHDAILDPLFKAWYAEAVLIPGYLPASLRGGVPRHEWYWDGHEPVDQIKDANAAKTNLESGRTNLQRLLADEGVDWEPVIRQRARELNLMRELGIPLGEQPIPGDGDGRRDIDDGDGRRDIDDGDTDESDD